MIKSSGFLILSLVLSYGSSAFVKRQKQWNEWDKKDFDPGEAMANYVSSLKDQVQLQKDLMDRSPSDEIEVRRFC